LTKIWKFVEIRWERTCAPILQLSELRCRESTWEASSRSSSSLDWWTRSYVPRPLRHLSI